MEKAELYQYEVKYDINHPTPFHEIVIHCRYQSIYIYMLETLQQDSFKNYTFSNDLMDDALLLL